MAPLRSVSEKSAYGVLFRSLRRFPLAPTGLPGGKRRKEALLCKARIRRACRRIRMTLGGLRPSKPPKGVFESSRKAQVRRACRRIRMTLGGLRPSKTPERAFAKNEARRFPSISERAALFLFMASFVRAKRGGGPGDASTGRVWAVAQRIPSPGRVWAVAQRALSPVCPSSSAPRGLNPPRRFFRLPARRARIQRRSPSLVSLSSARALAYLRLMTPSAYRYGTPLKASTTLMS